MDKEDGVCRRVGWRADVEGARANGGPQGAKGLCVVRDVGGRKANV